MPLIHTTLSGTNWQAEGMNISLTKVVQLVSEKKVTVGFWDDMMRRVLVYEVTSDVLENCDL
jgi:hypothetical protein